MKAVLDYLQSRQLTSRPIVSYVGDLCRTWYLDQEMCQWTMEILRPLRPVALYSDPVGFDLMVKKSIDFSGIDSIYIPRVAGARSLDLLEADIVIAFPIETAKPRRMPVSSADAALMVEVEAAGLPTLAVWRNGESTWST